MKTVLHFGIILLFLLMFTACELGGPRVYCDNNMNGKGLYVTFDWSLTGNEMEPPLMSVYFYAADQKNPYKYFLSGREGGKVKLPAGVYNVLCYNDDVDELFVDEEEGFFGVLGFTRVLTKNLPIRGGKEEEGTDESDDLDEPDDDEPTIASPGRLMTAQSYSLVVGEEDEEQTLILTPKEGCCYYSCRFVKVENKKYLSSIRCALSGLVKGIRLYDGTPTDEAAEMLFPLDFQEEGLYGETITFGALPTHHKLYVTLTLADGTQQALCYNVTKQVNQAPNPRKVDIIIDELIVPRTEKEPEGGFNADVGGWNDWTIDVDMRKDNKQKYNNKQMVKSKEYVFYEK